VQELVDAIETIQASLSTILVNDLNTGGVTKALTAQQGVVLKGLIDTLAQTVASKQATLISGTNIKTINNQSLLGEGNIDIVVGVSEDARNALTLGNDDKVFFDPYSFVELGNITGAVNVDMSFSSIEANMVSNNVVITLTNVIGGRVTTCCFKNTSALPISITFATTGVTFVGTITKTIPVPPLQSAVFSIRANIDETSFYCFVNSINYQITGNGITSTFNPNDSSSNPPIVLSNGFTTINANAIDAIEKMARCFGIKNTGKWQFTLRVDEPFSIGGGGAAYASFGISVASDSLSSGVGAGSFSCGLVFYYTSGSGFGSLLIAKRKANVVTSLGTFATRPVNQVAGTLNTFLIDFDAGKFWVAQNNIPMVGDPNAGTGEMLTTSIGDNYLPAVALREGSLANNAGRYTFLNEVQSSSSIVAFPSFNYWVS